VTDAITSARAILTLARLNQMTREYAAALSPPLAGATAYKNNPLRHKATLIACVVTDAHAIGDGMCEFEAVSQFGCKGERLRCIAPASLAIHIRVTDTITMVGTIIRHERTSFFGVEDIGRAH
jgi:hypothetical protein